MKNDAQVIARTADHTEIKQGLDIVSITAAAGLGLFLLFAAGFAQATVMHDTAHDQRHAMAFPCH